MNILLTSVGRRTYLIRYFQRALNGTGKVYASNSVITFSMKQADGYVVTPLIYDDSYIDFLLDFCVTNSVTVIISCFDIDLPVLAVNKDRFAKNGITVVVSSPEVTRICNDKWLTYKKITEFGLNTPRTWCTQEDVMKEIDSGSLSYPVILKPRWGMGSLGIYKANNKDEISVLYKKLHREIFESYLRFESKEESENCIIVQEMIQAQEYGLDVLNDLDANFVTVVAKKKIAMRAGETDIARVVDSQPFIETGKTISTKLRHVANLDVDCFLDEFGNVYVLELNCRFGGQYPFSHLAGVDFPKQIIEWLNGRGTKIELISPRIGVMSCKDLVPVVIELE